MGAELDGPSSRRGALVDLVPRLPRPRSSRPSSVERAITPRSPLDTRPMVVGHLHELVNVRYVEDAVGCYTNHFGGCGSAAPRTEIVILRSYRPHGAVRRRATSTIEASRRP
jgi:hypothetical protein